MSDLERSTLALQQEGWSEPPGSCHVFYRRRADALAARAPSREAPPQESRPTVAEFALGGTVLPRVLDAVRVADQLRRAVMSYWRNRGPGMVSATFTGKQGDAPRGDPHAHAHFLPDVRGGRFRDAAAADRITHLVVWAPEGFGADEQAALRHVRYLRLPWLAGAPDDEPTQHERTWDGDLDVVFNGVGTEEAFAEASGSSLFGPSRRWRSRTPFVLPRHVKAKRAADAPEAQLRRELGVRTTRGAGGAAGPFPEVVHVEPVGAWTPADGRALRWREFRRWREGDEARPHFGGFVMEFAEPVAGPVCLGYGSHFGLGMFEAAP